MQLTCKETGSCSPKPTGRAQETDTRRVSIAGKLTSNPTTGRHSTPTSKSHANHVLFVGFAPYEKPEVAFSVRIANGYDSSYVSQIGRDVVRKYFGLADDSELVFGKAGVLSAEQNAD